MTDYQSIGLDFLVPFLDFDHHGFLHGLNLFLRYEDERVVRGQEVLVVCVHQVPVLVHFVQGFKLL